MTTAALRSRGRNQNFGSGFFKRIETLGERESSTALLEEAIEPEEGPSAAPTLGAPEHSNAAAHNSTLPTKTR